MKSPSHLTSVHLCTWKEKNVLNCLKIIVFVRFYDRTVELPITAYHFLLVNNILMNANIVSFVLITIQLYYMVFFFFVVLTFHKFLYDV